jgi:8-oxo-dGTP diphosphatase
MKLNYTKVGVKILIRKGGKILLGKRLEKVGCGQWGLPGGHLEYGESLVSAAKRELLEETGLTADNLKFINVTNIPRKETHYIQFVFLARGIHGRPKVMEPDSCEQWEWFSPNKLPKPIFFGHKKLLEAVLKNKLFNDN